MTWTLFCALWNVIGLTERLRPILPDDSVANVLCGLSWRIARLEAEQVHSARSIFGIGF